MSNSLSVCVRVGMSAYKYVYAFHVMVSVCSYQCYLFVIFRVDSRKTKWIIYNGIAYYMKLNFSLYKHVTTMIWFCRFLKQVHLKREISNY